MNIHFISIGGAVMHNLAIALNRQGHRITGSDDEIFEPSRSRLKIHGLLPAGTGWFTEKITRELDAVILGMHARKDNPELQKALRLNLKVYSFPEFLFEQTKNKTRVVIGGSHGKTTLTAMVMHVLRANGRDFDYMVGSQVQGFDTMVGLAEKNRIAVFEGDEYLSSAINPRPKFHVYKPHIALLTGLSWDHINVFPEVENYMDQFRIFIETIEPGGILCYFENDQQLAELAGNMPKDIRPIPYSTPRNVIDQGITYLLSGNRKIPLKIFGDHNLQNLEGARCICSKLGIEGHSFDHAISNFMGAAGRLQRLAGNEKFAVYKDFAHAPSKVTATVEAVKKQFPFRKLFVMFELHTYSSLNAGFLHRYKNSLDPADEAIVFTNPETFRHKKLSPLTDRQIRKAFGRPDLNIYRDPGKLLNMLGKIDWIGRNLLIMSSGNFGGIDFQDFADSIL